MPPIHAPATAGPVVAADAVTFRLADPDPRHPLRAVRLRPEVRVPGDQLSFRSASHGVWSLRLPRPAVDRMEYLFELTHADGGTETVCDPGNPRRVPGAFGDKSAVELPGYAAPDWLAAAPPPGAVTDLALPARSVRGDVHGRLWAPRDVPAGRPLPLLVVHDGPEYDELAGLTTYLSALIDAGQLPPLRAALLSPGPRDDRYSANGAYTRALCLAVVPQLRRAVETSSVVGVGASLGALAMLHAQRRHAGTFDALFLQSGSFFHPRHDAHERRFAYYDRVVRSVDAVLRAGGHHAPVPALLTCGGVEENVENNRLMARALRAQGYDVALHELRDAHNYTAWRDAFDPHLTGLLRKVAG
jgi:enterochelin esterase-like enzyme